MIERTPKMIKNEQKYMTHLIDLVSQQVTAPFFYQPENELVNKADYLEALKGKSEIEQIDELNHVDNFKTWLKMQEVVPTSVSKASAQYFLAKQGKIYTWMDQYYKGISPQQKFIDHLFQEMVQQMDQPARQSIIDLKNKKVKHLTSAVQSPQLHPVKHQAGKVQYLMKMALKHLYMTKLFTLKFFRLQVTAALVAIACSHRFYSFLITSVFTLLPITLSVLSGAYKVYKSSQIFLYAISIFGLLMTHHTQRFNGSFKFLWNIAYFDRTLGLQAKQVFQKAQPWAQQQYKQMNMHLKQLQEKAKIYSERYCVQEELDEAGRIWGSLLQSADEKMIQALHFPMPN